MRLIHSSLVQVILVGLLHVAMDAGNVEEEIAAISPPTMGSMQIAGSNGFGHNIDFMPQPYLRNRYSKIDIEDHSPYTNKDRPLPIFLKVVLLLLHYVPLRF